MTYDLIKIAHIVAVVLWIGTMLAATFHVGRPLDPAVAWNWRRVMALAMGVTWAAGLYLGVSAGWFESGWLKLKLLFVTLLSAYHGLLTGHLRRAVERGVALTNTWGAAVIPVSLTAIVLLVTLKSF